ncbi:MAG: hypothetical protein ABTD50_18360 [Polyangiaceae bacterium]
MKRLVEEDLELGSALRPLADLVRGVAPLPADPVGQRSMLARLQCASLDSSRWSGFEPLRPGRTSPSVRRQIWAAGFAAVLLSAVAAASVVRWHGHVPWASGRTGSGALPVLTAGIASSSALPMSSSVPAASAEPEQALVEPPPAVEVPSARLKLATKGADRSPHLLGAGEDPTPVLEAIAALRDRGDAVRAGALLADHLKAHPRGVLAEDALALSIEAAIARHDARAAFDLGHRYLSQFPNGRYRAFAARASEP